MMWKNRIDALVVGAGPVGLFSAICLAQRGVDVQLIDRSWRTGAHSYALALHPASLALLSKAGLAEAIISSGQRIDTVAFYDGDERCAELRPGVAGGDYPFMLVLRQDAFEGMLEQRLRDLKRPVQWNHGLAGLQQGERGVQLEIEQWGRQSSGYAVATSEWVVQKSHRIEAGWVVGADGHRSTVRRLLDIPYDSAGGQEYFAVFEFQSDLDAPNEVRIVLDEHSTNVLWPMPDGYCRWSFQLQEGEIPGESRTKSQIAVQVADEAYPHLGREDLLTLLRERAPWFKGEVGAIRWSMAVRFERRLAGSFGRGHCWLAGDAAHLAGPVGIQSMNAGLLEGCELSNILADIIRENRPPNLLEQYSNRRVRQWKRLLEIGAAPHAGPQTPAWVRSRLPRLMPCLPATDDALDLLANQWDLRLE